MISCSIFVCHLPAAANPVAQIVIVIVIAGSEGQVCIDESSADLGQGGGVLDEAVPVKPAYRAQFDHYNWSAEE